MNCSVVTDCGVVVSAVCRWRLQDDATMGKTITALAADLPDLFKELKYECDCRPKPIAQKVFHTADVLPFGIHSPSTVFSYIGRHTNKGLVVGLSADRQILVKPYTTSDSGALRVEWQKGDADALGAQKVAPNPLFLEKVSAVSKSAQVLHDTRIFLEGCVRRAKGEMVPQASSDDSSNITSLNGEEKESSKTLFESRVLMFLSNQDWQAFRPGALQLTEPLNDQHPTPPLRVGSKVLARRYGCDSTLFAATIVGVEYDVSYSILYEADGTVEMDVLHNDVVLLDESDAEVCTVRDRVLIALQKQLTAIIIACHGNGEYTAILEENPDESIHINAKQIIYVTPLMVEALYSNEDVVQWFKMLDPGGTGSVAWKDVRSLLLSMDGYGEAFSFAKVGEMQKELCIRLGKVEPQLLRKVPVQEEEMRLKFCEFEYVILKAQNLM
ncbi:hypothetical protein STCU_02062 [Strigomonas culicis]|uniref:EF-hand domain-containing protein n=1 Tax=Strigomonas culicis TaxID=28005 RepID=S9UY92_9TRYP|nr:hypothetical protein STCU_02062 [Strigomonas culicis]|eukprot:EPY33704.1 hypothetical protein STCU_02062 [Strigomonas culicis]